MYFESVNNDEGAIEFMVKNLRSDISFADFFMR